MSLAWYSIKHGMVLPIPWPINPNTNDIVSDYEMSQLLLNMVKDGKNGHLVIIDDKMNIILSLPQLSMYNVIDMYKMISLAKEHCEKQKKLELEKLETLRKEKERIEKERIEKERIEKERIEKEKRELKKTSIQERAAEFKRMMAPAPSQAASHFVPPPPAPRRQSKPQQARQQQQQVFPLQQLSMQQLWNPTMYRQYMQM